MPHFEVTLNGKTYDVEAANGQAAAEAAAMAHARGAAAAPPKRSLMQNVNGYLSNVADNIPLLDEADALLPTGMEMLKGKSLPQAWNTVRSQQRAISEDFKGAHPILAGNAQGVGWAAQLVPAVLSAGASLAPTGGAVAKTAGGSLLKNAGAVAARLGKTGVKNATIGASYGSVNAVADKGSLKERLAAAEAAMLPSAAAGVVLPVLAAGAGKVGGAIANGSKTVGQVGVRLANKAAGGALLDPKREAVTRLAQALHKDKLGPDQITAAMNEWERVGGPSPAFLDLVGENTRALVRGAAMQGDGRAAATGYFNRVTADLQDNAIRRTESLTPDRRSAAKLTADTEALRKYTSDQLYPEFRADRVPVGDDINSALSGESGRAAVAAARRIADARRDYDVMAELDALGDGNARSVSAGTLDLIRRGLRDQASAAHEAGERSFASGLGFRRGDIENALLDVPGFNTARNLHRDYSQQIEAIETGATGLRAKPEVFADLLAEIRARDVEGLHLPAAQVGYREALTDAIGVPTEGATGTLNKIATSTNQGRNLAAAFGEGEAADYRQSLRNMIDQMNNARFINPNVNSPTAGRTLDEQLVSLPPMSRAGIVSEILKKVQAGVTLTDAERAAIVEIATSPAGQVRTPVSPPKVQLRGLGVSPIIGADLVQRNR